MTIENGIGRSAAGAALALASLVLAACGGPLDTGSGPVLSPAAVVEQRGPAPVAQEVTMRTPAPEAPRVEEARSVDTEIVMQVNQALDTDRDLASMKIDVSSDGGAVTLRGMAPDPDARERAAAIVRNLRSVKAVENLLTLG